MENQTTETTQTDAPEFTGRATYSPEDNKLRLYIGRVPRDEFLKLRAEGWVTLHKQREAGGGDFVAHWTPGRRDTALSYAGIIEDEDMGPEERAADRAERFGGYRDKRADEAGTTADRFDAGPAAHGFQSQARAERAARRHDRIAGRAVDAWDKAEYWQRRTAGVIAHALHVSSPGVRMGRIKDLESELRKIEKARGEYAQKYELWAKCATTTDTEKQNALAYRLAYVEHGDFTHPRTGRKTYLFALCAADKDDRNVDPLNGAEICALWLAENAAPSTEPGPWETHYRLRLAYENQMVDAQGGRAAFVEMVPGGFIRGHQIQKVNKSTATGRVVSVNVYAPTGANFDRKGKEYGRDNPRPLTIHTINVERMAPEAYRAPTAEELAAFVAGRKAEKAAAPKKPACPLINPTDADADRLVALWNENRRADHESKNIYKSEDARKMHAAQFKPCEVRRMPQAFYSAHSKGSYAKAETRPLCSLGRLEERNAYYDYSGQAQRAAERGPAICEVRTTGFDPVHVIILTDKPQKPLPAAVWKPFAKVQPAAPAPTEATQTALVLA